ncbi:MAG: hypothetical protein E7679_01455 [Ruminococcaceae bacterium]|nr:hypothetical protein [Oscillospiraceae bacterium]
MEISPYMLFLLLVYSFLFGMVSGAFNDVNRITRAILGVRYPSRSFERLYSVKLPFVGALADKRKEGKLKRGVLSAIIFIQDILLFAFMGCGTAILNYYLNRGQLRLYTIVAVAAGFAVYYFTLGRLVIFLSQGIVFLLRAVFGIAVYIISRPFIWIFSFVKRVVVDCYKKISDAIAKKKIISYNKKRRAELLALAQKGFIE